MDKDGVDPFFPTSHVVQSVQDSPVNVACAWYFDGGQFVHSRLTEEDGVDPFFPATQVDHGVHEVPINVLDA